MVHQLTCFVLLSSIASSNSFSISPRKIVNPVARQSFVSLRPYSGKTLNLYPNSDICDSGVEASFDQALLKGELKQATRLLENNPSSINVNKERMLEIFNAVEERTKEAEENNINKRVADDSSIDFGGMEYPPTSPARTEMTEMYAALKNTGNLKAFGAAADGNYPALGTKNVTPTLLEKITNLSMVSLTPKPTNTLLLAGAGLAVLEGFVSLTTGIELNFLIVFTLFLGFLDKLLVNGAVFETATQIGMPEYRTKILKHEAGHFLCAYLLGCPVEGFVLSTWAALSDARFGGKRTTTSAGTSFFDPSLSDEINGRRPLTRASIDRYSIIVMAGIAAEALNFGRADGGAGDEMALFSFLSNLNPRTGGAVTWNIDSIKNQARWGAAEAVLLLREYKECYNSLVDAMERGGDLGECVYAIENAVKVHGLPSIAEKPLGYIVDQGLYGEWVTTSFEAGNSPVDTKENETKSTREPTIEEEVISLEELKKRMQAKLKEIDSQLEGL